MGPTISPERTPSRRLAVALLATALVLPIVAAPAAAASGTYTNPLRLAIPSGGVAESCADPTVTYASSAQGGENLWYLYCTTDPLNGTDRDANGNLRFHLVPTFSSADLVNWTYRGDAFSARPSYATADAGLWAPEIAYYPAAAPSARWHLLYTVTDTVLPGGGSAIGVATAPSPTGPWTHAGQPVVEPHAADCCPGSRRWVFDPEVLQTSGPDYLYYGSYFGGISARVLSEDGMSTDPATQTAITIANRYEGAAVEKHGDWYYLFASATDCCRGPLTGYAVFVGRSANPTGPFLDRDGVSMLTGRVGGTPFLVQSGNRWVGPGHNTVFQDFAGQWWTVYHAVDVGDPYFGGAVGFTKRPALLDAVDWVDGWPTVNGGRGPSAAAQQAPAAQPGQTTKHTLRGALIDRPGSTIWSDGFDAGLAGWTWVREPDASTYAVAGGELGWDTQAADLYVDSNNASVLLRDLPTGDWVAETKVKVNVPAEGCCFNYVQAGLVVYGDDDNFLKLASVSIWETRQTEWAKELAPVPDGYPRYGNTVVASPGEWTWLRIVRRTSTANTIGGTVGGTFGGDELYTAYTSNDGTHWARGGTWADHFGDGARLGLVSMGGSGFRAEFDYVRVTSVRR